MDRILIFSKMMRAQFQSTQISSEDRHARHLQSLRILKRDAFPKFKTIIWTFGYAMPRMGITTHYATSEEAKEIKEHTVMEFIERALQYCLANGAEPHHLVHFYLNCYGLDSTFVFNPAGIKKVTFEELLSDHNIENVVDKFMVMIQSGKTVYLDEYTNLKIYAFDITGYEHLL